MTDTSKPSGPLSAIAAITGVPLDDVYKLFRLPDAPQPIAHVACVPVYDLEAATQWVLPPDEPGAHLAEPQPVLSATVLEVPALGTPVKQQRSDAG